jgi:enoyl-CoA hydratase
LGLPEVSLGILPGYGGTQRLTKLVGKGRAMEMILTGEMIDAETAQSIGLINKICQSTDELMTTAKEYAYRMLKNAPIAIGLAIESINAATDFEKNGFQVESNSFLRCLKTKDFIEGTNAFLNKKSPIFTGE